MEVMQQGLAAAAAARTTGETKSRVSEGRWERGVRSVGAAAQGEVGSVR